MRIVNACCLSRWKIASLGALALTLVLGMNCSARADAAFSTNAAAQIFALEQEKASFTPTEQKMDSQLIFAYKKSQNIPIAGGAVPQMRIGAQADTNGMIQVDITGTVTQNFLKQIMLAGGTIINSFPQYNAVRASVPLAQVENIAALPALRFIRSATKMVLNNSDPEGVADHRDVLARNNYHVDGTGVKIGVMSDSVDYLGLGQSLGDLGPVTVLPGQSGVPGTGEGSAMLEIVHAMAPGAQLYFATGEGGEANFAQNIIALRQAGCDIIVDDITYPDESPFQDGIVAQAVSQVVASGALFFSSAANSGNLDSGQSGTWEGNFVNGGGVTTPKGAGQVHSFGAANYDIVTQESSEGIPTTLSWSDPLGASTNDYDLYILDANGMNIISSSVTVQNGSQDPYETVPAPLAGQQVVVVLFSGTNRFLHIDTDRGVLTIGTQGSTRGHNASTNAFTVAATPSSAAAEPGFPSGPYPGVFTGAPANVVEPFSSDGPRHMFYKPDGTPLTPTNFSSTGGVIYQKPDVTAADGVTTSIPGFAPFFGTSAAAPHAAAITALLKQYSPALTLSQIRTVFTNSALDIMTNGVDRDSGVGIIMPDLAMAAAPIPLPVPNLVIVTNFLSGGNGNGLIDEDECNSLLIVLTNFGSTTATAIQATLYTTTPGVTISGPTSLYTNLPVGASGTNLTPFQISTSPLFVCGTTVNFALVTKCDQITQTNLFALLTATPGTPVRFDNTGVVNIPDNNPVGTNSTIVVSNVTAALQHVAVSLNIIHPFVSDLTLYLIGPDGTTNILAQNVGASGQNFGIDCSDADRTTFDDNGSSSILTANAPFIGTFQPEQQLITFNGKSGSALNGPWQLRMVDAGANGVGYLQCWSLIITPAACLDGGGPCPGVDLALGMTGLPNPVMAQSNLTYTITVTNNGPQTATEVSVSQSIPTSATFVSATPSQGTASFGSGIMSCNLGTMLVGSNATITVVVVPQTAGTIFSSATVGSLEQDLNPANNTANISTLVLPASADLGVVLTANPNPVLLDGLLTYTATINNYGPSMATNVVVTNTLPQNASLYSTSASQGTISSVANIVVADLGSLPSGSNATVTIQVYPLVLGLITAKSVVSASTFDPNLANNSSTINVNVTPAADLVLTLSGPASAVVGSNVTYVVSVENLGPSTATGVVIKDTLPSGVASLTATSPQGPCTTSGGIVSCTVSNLAAGSNATVTITASTTGLVGKAPTNAVDSASVSANQSDPNTTNNSASLTTVVNFPMVNVTAVGSVLEGEAFAPTNGMIDPGETVKVLLEVQNLGNISTANNLTATLLATNGVTPVGTQVQVFGSLAAGSAPVGLPFIFTAAATNGEAITATLQFQNNGTNLPLVSFPFTLSTTSKFANTTNIIIPDHGPGVPYPSSNLVSGVTGLVGRVAVTMTNVNHTFPDDIDMLLVGPGGQSVLLMSHAGYDGVLTNTSITFDNVVTNSIGNLGTSNYIFSSQEYLPPSSQILSGTYAPSQYGAVNFTNTFGGTIVINTNNPPPQPPYGTNLNVFNGTSANGYWKLWVFDSSPGDNGVIVGGWSLQISAGTEINPVVDLAVTGKFTPTSGLLAGNNLTYTFTITNNSPNVASAVQFTNVLPTNVAFVSVANSANAVSTTNGNGVVYCLLTNLHTGSNVTVTVVVTPTAPGTVTDTATVTGSGGDPNLSNNSATLVTTATAPIADLAVTMTGATNSLIGSNVLYTVIVTNNGPGTALDVLVTDPLQGILSFVSGTSTGSLGSPSSNGSSAVCNLGNLASGTGATVTFLLTSVQSGTVTNTAPVTTLSTDPNLANNSASVVTVFSVPTPSIVAAGAKLISGPANGSIAPGQSVNISLQLANVGTANTVNLVGTLLATGGVVSPSGPADYGALVYGGPTVGEPYSFTVSGTNGGVIVATLQLQDGTNTLPPVSFTFNLPATNSFANSNYITIPDHGPGTPYPSIITVSGVTGFVSKATVTLNNFTHQFPNDVQIMLVGPAGQNLVLMSGTGGAYSVTNAALTFDDAAIQSLPASSLYGVGLSGFALGQIFPGTFKPTDDGQALPFPSPAPASPSGSSLATFNGSNPDGPWTLYVFDNSPGDNGYIALGWSLNLVTISPVSAVSDLAVGLALPASGVFIGHPVTLSGSITNSGPANASNVTLSETLSSGLSLAGSSLGSYTTGAGGALLFNLGSLNSGSTTNFTLTVLPSASGFYSDTVSVSADQTDLNPANNSSQVQFQALNPPSLSAVTGKSNGVLDLTLTLTGPAGTYNILASTNLQSNLSTWTVVGTVMNTTGTIQFTDTNVVGYLSRYYAAVLVP